ncbi:MAG TPA: hypothetical protein VFY84_13950 [Jiangellales bacterium]|nr:hypothetical protein [Jiangellales bacterium]
MDRSPGTVPYPALPDAFYLAMYLALTIALFWLVARIRATAMAQR